MNVTLAVMYEGLSYKLSNEVHSFLIIFLECLLVIGAIWLIFKKDNSKEFNISKCEEERLIRSFKSESLVEKVDTNHFVMNPNIIVGRIGLYLNINGRKCINFASHDYFGLTGDKSIEDRVMRCIDTYGVGSCGPRGFYGTTIEHLELEQTLADIFNAESSLVYSYGFATVASAIPSYAKKTDIIFVDEKCKFAIQKGLEASKSEIKYFKHNDMKDLEQIMANQHKLDLTNLRKARKIRRYLIAEGIYINTGNICPLPELVRLCKHYKVRLFLDESISFGTLGRTGRGVTEYFGVSLADVDLIMGSFEHALASVGGFSAGSRLLIDHQQISGQGYCFSASLPPLLATAVMGALQVIKGRSESLNSVCRVMHNKLTSSMIIGSKFIITGDQDSPVHMLTLKDEIGSQKDAELTMNAILSFCISKNVALIRAASLHEDKARIGNAIRVTTNLYHTEDQISYLIQVLEEACITM